MLAGMKLSYTCSLGLVAVVLACTPTTGTTETTESGGSTTETGTTGTETTGTTTTTGIMTSTDPTPTTAPTTGGSATTEPEDLCANVDCNQMEECHPLGECDPMTGECVYDQSQNGKPCNEFVEGCSGVCLDGACVDAGIMGAAVDQSLFTTSGFLPITAADVPSQTFTAGASGLLTAIEIAAVGCDPLPPAGSIKLVLLDADNITLAEATAPIDALGNTCMSYELSGDVMGPGLFDLSDSCVAVEAGQQLRFLLELEGVPAGVCEAMGKKCSAGKVGEGCFDDLDCDFQIGAGLDFGGYAGGDLLLGDAPQADQDLTFKTIVAAM